MAVRPASRLHCTTKITLRMSACAPHGVGAWPGVVGGLSDPRGMPSRRGRCGPVRFGRVAVVGVTGLSEAKTSRLSRRGGRVASPPAQARPSKRRAALSPSPCAPVVSRHRNTVLLPVALGMKPLFASRCLALLRHPHDSRTPPRSARPLGHTRHARGRRHCTTRTSVSTRVRRSGPRGPLHSEVCTTVDLPDGQGRLMVDSSLYAVLEITPILRSVYANEDHAPIGGSQQSLRLERDGLGRAARPGVRRPSGGPASQRRRGGYALSQSEGTDRARCLFRKSYASTF
jgi:hypothetical protein